jgi:RNA polymerase sigma-70 factor (ECF subfamily)
LSDEKYDSTDTQLLLKRVRAGDRDALNRLFEQHRPYLRQLLELRMTKKLKARVDPSDVVQETQIEVARRIDGYLERQPMSFRVWLRKTADEQLIMMYRRHMGAERRSVQREVSLPAHSSVALAKQFIKGGPSEELERRELASRVRDAVECLPDADREILLLRNFEELTNREAAEVLEIDAATASKRYGRALLRLRNILVEGGLSGVQT